MQISLILPTINRRDELREFLVSLERQTYKDFELIILDQNPNELIYDMVQDFQKRFNIKYIKSDERGLSFNRNRGLIMACGDIIGFPDDDCEYQEDILEKVVKFFDENKDYKIFSCRTLERGKNYGTGVMSTIESDIEYSNVEETVKSITFFVNYELEDLALFDVNLGVGSYFGSGEETDYVLSLLHKGFRGRYYPEEIIYHPAKKGNYKDLQKAYSYALGYGALVKKEVKLRGNSSYFFKYLMKLFKPFVGLIISFKKKYYLTVLSGRIEGYKLYKIEEKK